MKNDEYIHVPEFSTIANPFIYIKDIRRRRLNSSFIQRVLGKKDDYIIYVEGTFGNDKEIDIFCVCYGKEVRMLAHGKYEYQFSIEHYKKGLLHCETGPAIISKRESVKPMYYYEGTQITLPQLYKLVKGTENEQELVANTLGRKHE